MSTNYEVPQCAVSPHLNMQSNKSGSLNVNMYTFTDVLWGCSVSIVREEDILKWNITIKLS
jgi:hypothetical protein